MRSYAPNLQFAPINDRNYRPAFWAEFLSRRTRRESIAQRLHDLSRLEANPEDLTPRQTERVAPRVEAFLRDLSEVPAYRPLLEKIELRFELFAAAAADWAWEYASSEDWSDYARDARRAVERIFDAHCPKTIERLQTYSGSKGYYRAKRRAICILNRDFPGLTQAERIYALAPFAPYKTAAKWCGVAP